MAFVPLFVILIIYGHLWLGLLVFFCAGITDILDGLIARKYGQRTYVGTFLDPLADKLLLTSSFILLSLDSLGLEVRIPLWLTITVISRDLLLVLSVLIFNLTIERRAFPPSRLGKYTTVCQLGLILMVLVSNLLAARLPGLDWVIYLTLTLTVLSGLHYMVEGMRLIGQESGERETASSE
jgi:cardiolipin synthase